VREREREREREQHVVAGGRAVQIQGQLRLPRRER
jgi:hypothetical protein